MELVSLPHFLHDFWTKTFVFQSFINWTNFTAWLLLLCEILVNMCFRNSLLTRYWCHKIWDYLSIQAYMTKKLRQKFKYIEKKKSTTISFFWKVKAWLWVFSIGITLVDVLLNWLNWFNFLFLKGGLLIILNCMIFLSSFLAVTRMSTS